MALLRRLCLIFCINSALMADTPEQELLGKVFHLMTRDYQSMRVYETDPAISLKDSHLITVVNDCRDANILYGASFESLPIVCQLLPRFTTEYRIYQEDKQSIGAFYWRKGRPQLRFNKERCDAFTIVLPEALVNYVQ